MPVIDRRGPPRFAPRLSALVLSALGVYLAFDLLSQELQASPRANLLAYIGALFFVRFALMLLLLVPRPVPWWEALSTGCGMALLPGLFVAAASPIDLDWLDAPAVAVHVIGSVLTSGSEWLRWRWKQQPANAGHLYVGGLFAFARHINYFGEILTFLGWALLTLSPAALLLPLGFATVLRLAYAPDLDNYIARRYGKDKRFNQWQQLPSLVPGGGGYGSPWTDLLTLSLVGFGVMALARTFLAVGGGLAVGDGGLAGAGDAFLGSAS